MDRNSKTSLTNVIDTEGLGRPSTSTTDENQEARAIILAQKKSKTEDMALHRGVSQGTAYSLVLDILGLSKVSARWVPKTSD